MATKSTKSTDVPAKTPKQEAVDAVIALMAPGKAMSQMTLGSDDTGEPNMIVIYLRAAA
ncbi:hypothetical protein [Sphingomonas sp. Leaf20]|uniref:hypothetical protein n=1 Tax=Sphingomonas sp. Leaf20 TaxID=1735685 RepID=UPI000A6B2FE1|nr:hypothetical protein [Sphingomonas sp. Leaf20]